MLYAVVPSDGQMYAADGEPIGPGSGDDPVPPDVDRLLRDDALGEEGLSGLVKK